MGTTAQIEGTVAGNVRHKIAKFNRGRVFLADHVQMESSSRQAVQRSLARLADEGLIDRIQNGIYYKPEVSKILKGKQIPPDVNQVIKVIAEKNNETIQLHGGAAANRLGLSTQVPMHKVFHTNGITREIEISGTKVYFVHTNNAKLLQHSGTKVGLAISAMQYLGKNLVNEKVIHQIKEHLSEREFKQLRKANLVGWMKEALEMAEEHA